MTVRPVAPADAARSFLKLGSARWPWSSPRRSLRRASPSCPHRRPAPIPMTAPPPTRGAGEAQATSEPGDIVVTGFRAALENAVAEKKNRDLVVESVSAEDIGKLPDASIAESIARLPGVTSQRVNGRSNAISIRGFAPDFSTTLLNGREQTSTGDNRAVEYDQYPAEVVNQVLIYKTANAGLIGQGLSGTVDLKTIRRARLREARLLGRCARHLCRYRQAECGFEGFRLPRIGHLCRPVRRRHDRHRAVGQLSQRTVPDPGRQCLGLCPDDGRRQPVDVIGGSKSLSPRPRSSDWVFPARCSGR